MCLTLTTKYAHCGCIIDKSSTICRPSTRCLRKEMVLIEDLTEDRCTQCLSSAEKPERLMSLIAAMEEERDMDDSGMIVAAWNEGDEDEGADGGAGFMFGKLEEDWELRRLLMQMDEPVAPLGEEDFGVEGVEGEGEERDG
ncbi:hypothetical protein BO71DRAFT_482661 [Aspergillus ellipticus CBS 707.79]|uniref:Uncharacterized protein n=1 Tax=Aspergillus ellipticus CBS 707.79 TaxID=1448320 RepID=A0A319DEG2_9EURO|nr:hypothetical protein BO71DRAFT_482661 [Aspergillus ellipticus CBS 707.79]